MTYQQGYNTCPNKSETKLHHHRDSGDGQSLTSM